MGCVVCGAVVGVLEGYGGTGEDVGFVVGFVVAEGEGKVCDWGFFV